MTELERTLVDLVQAIIWPLTVMIAVLVLRPRRYSEPLNGPSGQIIRHDRRRDRIEILDPATHKWRLPER